MTRIARRSLCAAVSGCGKQRLVLAPIATDAKSNEIAAMPKLLARQVRAGRLGMKPIWRACWPCSEMRLPWARAWRRAVLSRSSYR